MDQEKKSILVVDDEEDICDLGRFSFERAGFTVFTADNITEGLAILDQNQIDVVITDMWMPKGDGVELLKQISGRPGQPLVYLMSGFSEMTEVTALQLGATGIFAKPFDWKLVLTTIRKELGITS